MQTESWMKFCSLQNISGASQAQNSQVWVECKFSHPLLTFMLMENQV